MNNSDIYEFINRFIIDNTKVGEHERLSLDVINMMSKSICLEKLSLTNHKDKSTLRVGELREYIKRLYYTDSELNSFQSNKRKSCNNSLSENNNSIEQGNCTDQNLSVNLNTNNNSNIYDSNGVSNVEANSLEFNSNVIQVQNQSPKFRERNSPIADGVMENFVSVSDSFFRCIHCNKKKSGKYITNLHKHLGSCYAYKLKLIGQVKPATADEVDLAVCKMIIELGLSQSSVENPSFQNFINTLQALPKESIYNLPSRRKIKDIIIKMNNDLSKQLDQKIEQCNYVSIQYDGWKSLSKSEMVGVNATLISNKPNKRIKIEEVVLSIKSFNGSHSAENISTHIKDVLGHQMKDKLIWVVTDNAYTMTKSGELLTDDFPHLITNFGCKVHKDQLLVCNIMKSDVFTPSLSSYWKSIEHFQKSTSATEKIKDYQRVAGITKPKSMKIANDTRWMSEYDALKRYQLLNEYVKKYFVDRIAELQLMIDFNKEKQIIKYNNSSHLSNQYNTVEEYLNKKNIVLKKQITDLEKLKVSEKDSNLICILLEILGEFRVQTTILQDKETNISDVVPSYLSIKDQLLNVSKKSYSNNSNINSSIKSCLEKVIDELDQRYDCYIKIGGDNIIIHPLFATFLNPNYHTKPILELCKGFVNQSVFLRAYKDICSKIGIEPGSDEEVQGELVALSNVQDDYIKNQNIDKFEWWFNNIREYKYLYEVAVILLAIACTSVNSERLFSTAGRVITKDKCSLTDKYASILIFLRQNLKLDTNKNS
ncbi:hypothetical protein ACTFIZ_001307 [Dictyostelium cf. discoideum]